MHTKQLKFRHALDLSPLYKQRWDLICFGIAQNHLFGLGIISILLVLDQLTKYCTLSSIMLLLSILFYFIVCCVFVCLIADDNQFSISDTTQFIDYYTQLSNTFYYLYSLSGLL